MLRLIELQHAGVMCPIAEDRINKMRRRDSLIYGVEELKISIRSVMENYMYHGAEYSINVSAFTRMTALNSYDQLGLRMERVETRANRNENEAENGNETEHETSTSEADSPGSSECLQPQLSVNSQREMILRYVTIFDRSLEEIIGLLKLDSLSRFYRSKEYKIMTQKD